LLLCIHLNSRTALVIKYAVQDDGFKGVIHDLIKHEALLVRIVQRIVGDALIRELDI